MELRDDFKKGKGADRKIDRLDEEDQDQELTEHLEDGDDAIEIEMNEGEKITYGATLDAMEGNLGDESEDTDDLPRELKSIGNRYDQTLSSGDSKRKKKNSPANGFQIKDEDHIGMAYNEDQYTKDSDEDLEGPLDDEEEI